MKKKKYIKQDKKRRAPAILNLCSFYRNKQSKYKNEKRKTSTKSKKIQQNAL